MRRADEEGASVVEYGLLVVAVAAVLVAVLAALGGVVHDTFQKHSDCFSSQLNSKPCS